MFYKLNKPSLLKKNQLAVISEPLVVEIWLSIEKPKSFLGFFYAFQYFLVLFDTF